MGRYKYRGNWHRDFTDWDGDLGSLKTIQVALYLKNQDGFRIFKYDYDSLLRGEDQSFKDPDLYTSLPFTCQKEYFDEIKGVAGTALFFSPGLLHQGNSFTKRLDYHLRFSCAPLRINGTPVNESTMFDYLAPEFYLKDFDVEQDSNLPRNRDASFLEKIQNSANYYTGAVNLARILRDKKRKKRAPEPPWSYSWSANTIFQS